MIPGAAQASPSTLPVVDQTLQTTPSTHLIAFPVFPMDLLFKHLPIESSGNGSQASFPE
jgi:hypothetical protein